jgi:hypothetical protein
VLVAVKYKKDKIVLKIFDEDRSEKRAHNCYLCQIYKREAAKGDKDALAFYKSHLNSIVKKYRGVTIVLNAQRKPHVLTAKPIKR